jgi:hypothetical protein
MNRITRNGVLAISAALLFASSGAVAQDAGQSAITDQQKLDQQIEMMRKDVRSQKKQLIAANLTLTDKEAEKFWPIYDQYTADLVKINNTKYELIKQYAQNFESLNDDQIDKSLKDWLGLDQSVVQLRSKYLPAFRKALSAKNTARYLQLDRRLQNMIDLQIQSTIPLVPSSQ